MYRDHLAPISRIARADLPDTPEIQPLKMPRGKPSTQKLVSIARGMSKAAAPYAPVFVLGQGEPEMTGHRAATLLRAMLERPDMAAVFVRHRVDTEALVQDLFRLP